MLKALSRRYKISKLQTERIHTLRQIDCDNYISRADRDTARDQINDDFLRQKKLLFKKGPTFGGRVFMLGYNIRYEYWRWREKRIQNWLLYATPYWLSDRTVKGIGPVGGDPVPDSVQNRVTNFFTKYDRVVASTVEARKRHIPE